jgi:hypothetical protein
MGGSGGRIEDIPNNAVELAPNANNATILILRNK